MKFSRTDLAKHKEVTAKCIHPVLTANICEGLGDESLGLYGGQELKICCLYGGRSHQPVTGELNNHQVFQSHCKEPISQGLGTCMDSTYLCGFNT